LRSASPVGDVPFGYFGASTGAAAALWAAAAHGDVSAIVSRGGRPDLAAAHLAAVAAPTLLIVGGSDPDTLDLNRRARRDMRCITELVTIPAATHMFEEPGTLDQVADQAAAWFMQYL
jgi:putative phosphoribosyl transferase